MGPPWLLGVAGKATQTQVGLRAREAGRWLVQGTWTLWFYSYSLRAQGSLWPHIPKHSSSSGWFSHLHVEVPSVAWLHHDMVSGFALVTVISTRLIIFFPLRCLLPGLENRSSFEPPRTNPVSLQFTTPHSQRAGYNMSFHFGLFRLLHPPCFLTLNAILLKSQQSGKA